MPTRHLPLAVLATALAAPALQATEPWELLKYAPAGTNSVLTINVQQMLASPRAKKDGWAKLDHTEYLAGAVPVSPAVERIMVAKAIQPGVPGLGGAVAFLPMKSALDLPLLGTKLGGTPTTVGEEPAVLTVNGSYLVPLSGNVLAAAWGGSKQQLAGWLRVARAAEKSTLHRALSTTVADTAGRHHVCLVVDADELLEPAQVKAAVAATKGVEGSSEEAKQLETYLTGLTTVTLTADVAEKGLVTRLSLNSRALAGKLKPDTLKAFLVELLDRTGARLEDFPSSVGKQSERAFHFDFRLSDPELARITHLFLPPLPGATDASSIAVAPAGPTAEVTGRYYRAVNKQVDGLRRKLPGALDEKVALVWYDSAVNALLTTSVLGVDPAAVVYALSTAGRLRAITDSLRGQPARLEEMGSKAYLYALAQGNRGFFGVPHGSSITQVNTNLPEVRAKQAEAIRKDAASREALWKAIDAQRTELRGAMATKYSFDPDKVAR